MTQLLNSFHKLVAFEKVKMQWPSKALPGTVSWQPPAGLTQQPAANTGIYHELFRVTVSPRVVSKSGHEHTV